MVTKESIKTIREWASKRYAAAREKYDTGGTSSLAAVERYEDIVDICDKAEEALAESDDAMLRRHRNIEALIKQVPEHTDFEREDVVDWMRKCIM